MESRVENTSQPKSKVVRRYHRKSRTGCQRCRARRVKCDETRPVCLNCNRHLVPCIYNSPTVSSAKTAEQSKDHDGTLNCTVNPNLLPENGGNPSSTLPTLAHNGTRSEVIPSTNINDANAFDFPESESRRLLELRLLHHYLTNLSQPFPVPQSAAVRAVWSVEVPKMAFQHSNILYTLFTTAVLNLLRTDANNAELIAARQYYLDLALREHRKAVSQLSSKNADAVCLASIMILIDAVAALHVRVIEPYSPPTEWLQMGRGAGSVFKAALNIAKADETAKVMIILKAPPVFDESSIVYTEEDRREFLGLLNPDIPTSTGSSCTPSSSSSSSPPSSSSFSSSSPSSPPSEIWDTETRTTYEKTLSYIGSIHHAILLNNEPVFAIHRRLMGFALLVPNQFIEFVEQRRPRALVVLAHYFAVAARTTPIWYFGDTIGREILGIWGILPEGGWRACMEWPLRMAGLKVPL
ncbi:MAG: hypothetical protein M1834_007539 [Cirrosporium novae-zelandiae]|nr:MAG: hypothetical protein M1834_007539 [Cirrosporium novae-zelandiae]